MLKLKHVVLGTAKGLHSNEIMLANCSIRICPLKSARIVKTAVQFFSNKTETTQARRKVKIGFDSTNPRGSGGVTRRPLASRFLSKVGVQSLSSFTGCSSSQKHIKSYIRRELRIRRVCRSCLKKEFSKSLLN